MEIILLLICLTATTIIGWCLLGIIFYKSDSLAFLERLALSYGMGMGAITLEIFLCYFFRIQLNISNLLLPWIPFVLFGFIFSKPK